MTGASTLRDTAESTRRMSDEERALLEELDREADEWDTLPEADVSAIGTRCGLTQRRAQAALSSLELKGLVVVKATPKGRQKIAVVTPLAGLRHEARSGLEAGS